MKIAALTIVLLLTGCATTFGVREVAPSGNSSGNVLKLTDYPANREYQSISTIEITAYKAGLSQPTVDDVWGEVSQAVSSKGGNACLLRGSRSDDVWARRIWVTCEVLAVSELRR